MSEEEEAKRRRQLEESNATALFDDNLQMCVLRVLRVACCVSLAGRPPGASRLI